MVDMDRTAPAKLPSLAIVGLALLAVPRVVLHDLDVIHEGTFVNALFVFVPPLLWIVVVVWRRVQSPFLTLLVVGGCYGILLAIGHQVLWNQSFGANPPRLGGNLSTLDPAISALVVRGFAVLSSIVTGLVVGAVSGLLAWLVSRVVFGRREHSESAIG